MMDIERILEVLRTATRSCSSTAFSRSAHERPAIKNVTANESFFVGHFPQKKVMPGC